MTGNKLHLIRRQHYLLNNLNLDSTLQTSWTRLSRYHQKLYEAGAERARYFRNTSEGLRILRLPLAHISYRVNYYSEIKKGSHLSWPIEKKVGLRLSRLARHHVIVCQTYNDYARVRIVQFSGTQIKDEVKDIRDKLVNKVLQRHEYGELRTYSADTVVSRAMALVGKKGVYKCGYNFLTNNCETISCYMKTGASFCMQTDYYDVPT